jgi:hypothetical protein
MLILALDLALVVALILDLALVLTFFLFGRIATRSGDGSSSRFVRLRSSDSIVVEVGSIGVADTQGATNASNSTLPRTDFLFTANINYGIGDINLVFSLNQIILGEAPVARQSGAVGNYIKKY